MKMQTYEKASELLDQIKQLSDNIDTLETICEQKQSEEYTLEYCKLDCSFCTRTDHSYHLLDLNIEDILAILQAKKNRYNKLKQELEQL